MFISLKLTARSVNGVSNVNSVLLNSDITSSFIYIHISVSSNSVLLPVRKTSSRQWRLFFFFPHWLLSFPFLVYFVDLRNHLVLSVVVFFHGRWVGGHLRWKYLWEMWGLELFEGSGEVLSAHIQRILFSCK